MLVLPVFLLIAVSSAHARPSLERHYAEVAPPSVNIKVHIPRLVNVVAADRARAAALRNRKYGGGPLIRRHSASINASNNAVGAVRF